MPTKINNATKQLALQKLRDGLSPKEVSDLTGVSPRTLQTWKQRHIEGKGVPARKPVQMPGVKPIQVADGVGGLDEREKTTLDFEESPTPVEKKGIVDNALNSLKGMLGMDPTKEAKAPPIVSAKLNAKQQQFVDAAAPTLALAAMAIATWMWGRIGPEYSVLAPDEKVAERIVTPLLRVYARHSNFLTDINPDVADIGASMFALVGYVHVSLGLYQQIKREKEDYEQGYAPENNVSGIHRSAAPQSEDGTRNQSRGYADVRRKRGVNGEEHGRDGGTTGSVDLSHLTDKQAREHEALSRLAQLDFEHRARRSGRPA